MSINNEKLIIYQLMHEIIKERRELSKQYYDLKTRIDQFDREDLVIESNNNQFQKKFEKERTIHEDYLLSKNKATCHNSFDRVSKNIVSILKHSGVPLNSKQILERLTSEYEIPVSLKNLTCNILPKMKNEKTLPIQKACRGYWQYKQSS